MANPYGAVERSLERTRQTLGGMFQHEAERERRKGLLGMKEAELGLTKLGLEERMKERDFNRWLKTPGTIDAVFKQGVKQGYIHPDQADAAVKLFGEAGGDINMVTTPENLAGLQKKLMDASKPIKVSKGEGLYDPVNEKWIRKPSEKDKDRYKSVSPGGLYDTKENKWVREPDEKDKSRYKAVSPGGLYDTKEGVWIREPGSKGVGGDLKVSDYKAGIQTILSFYRKKDDMAANLFLQVEKATDLKTLFGATESTYQYLNKLAVDEGNEDAMQHLEDLEFFYDKLAEKLGVSRPESRQKGLGYFGELPRSDGRVSTEISIGVNLDGKETEIPLLTPNQSAEQIDYLLKFDGDPKDLDPAVLDNAVAHARERIAAGKSPFAQKGEQTEVPASQQEEITLPETIKTTSEALDYLMKTYQMDEDSAVNWLRSAMTAQQ